MGKHKNKTKLETYPFVSLCTPTFNRRPFIPYMIRCFELQTYPKDRIEWIIIDDGTDPIGDLVTNIPQVKYFYYGEQMLLGKKRNLMHSKCTGDIIIYMDDDDYYPPERISHAVETLINNPKYLIAGLSEMYIYFNSYQMMYKCGPYGRYHSTAATFAFRKELLLQTKYTDEDALSEENTFTKQYTIPLIQLDPLKTILVFSHKHNSLNKEKLLENPVESKTQPSMFTVDDFIKDPILKEFYTFSMNNLLENYKPGIPENKPELLAQMKKIDEERQKRIDEHNNMLKAQQKLLSIFERSSNKDVETLRNEYEKKLSDKNIIINELLKKVKALTIELDDIKKKIN